MFSAEQLIADCRRALEEPSPQDAIKEIARRAISDPAGVVRALGYVTAVGNRRIAPIA